MSFSRVYRSDCHSAECQLAFSQFSECHSVDFLPAKLTRVSDLLPNALTKFKHSVCHSAECLLQIDQSSVYLPNAAAPNEREAATARPDNTL